MHPYQHVHYVPLPVHPQHHLPSDMKIAGTTAPSVTAKADISKHVHIFVGDLSPDVEEHQLREAFCPFGDVSECKVIRDPATYRSKGFGFVSFLNKQDAEFAIQAMNGQWLGSRPIRTNWATRRPLSAAPTLSGQPLNYDEVHSQSSDSNCTVYCGGVHVGLSEELMRETFRQFGTIHEVRIFQEKGFAFVRFGNKESATKAICSVHGSAVQDQVVKCSWGKESNDAAPAYTPSQMPGVVTGAAVVSGMHGLFSGGCYGTAAYPSCVSSQLPSPLPHYLPTTGVGPWAPCTPPLYRHCGSTAAVQWGQTVGVLGPQQLSQQQSALVAYPTQPGFPGQ